LGVQAGTEVGPLIDTVDRHEVGSERRWVTDGIVEWCGESRVRFEEGEKVFVKGVIVAHDGNRRGDSKKTDQAFKYAARALDATKNF
jgi:hypothetical protein